MNHATNISRAADPTLDPSGAAQSWLVAFETALAQGDRAAIAGLFHEDCHWRDILMFTWDYASARGRDDVAARLAEAQARVEARGFHLPPHRKPPRRIARLGRDTIEALFEFTSAIGVGAGVLRLSAAEGAAEGEAPKAWHLATMLEEIEGHPERVGDKRPSGSAFSRNFGGENWLDMRRRQTAYADRDPTALVIGGAQAGLAVAARLKAFGVDTLVVERWARIGDSWRKRYHSLALHNSIHLNHLPYLNFPETFPKYIPKDMLGNWFEHYADALEINNWTGTEFAAGEWDAKTKTWTVRLKREDGSERVLRPKHLVFANGVSSYPYIPDIPGLKDFRGEVVHSEGFETGARWAGKRAAIIGTGSSANDIALDLHSFGVQTTLVQRGSTTVVSIDPSARLNEAVWDEGPPLADCDLIASAASYPLMVEGYQRATERMLELDREMIEGLKRIGFKFDIGEDKTGHQMKYFRRGGGYNLDAGSSDLLIKGELGLLDYDRIETVAADGFLLKDGSSMPLDVIILATGYYPQLELVRRALGEEMVKRIGPVWGIGADGEMNNMYRRTPQENLWFMAGALPQCRMNSKYLALQILATELGLLGPLRTAEG